ncbi:MAG: hypothetical protein WC341_16995 [Bacteroidales bacterium]|jgi:hypothetical protein
MFRKKSLFVLCILFFASVASAGFINDPVSAVYPPDFSGMTPIFEVKGSESINVNGLYFENGTYTDYKGITLPVYQCNTSPYAWLWQSTEPSWIISLYPGNYSMWVWKNYYPEPAGVFYPQFYSKGQCTVSNVPEPSFGVFIGVVLLGAGIYWLAKKICS